jgi:hypothetical protein
MLSKLSRGYKVSSSGAGLAVLCFFLPWIRVSCAGQSVDLSGWQLAAGTTVGSGFGAQRVPGEPILFLVLLAGLGVLALAYFSLQRGYLTELDGLGVIGLGALPLLVLFIKFSGTHEQPPQLGFVVEYRYGLWGVILGYIAVIVGGVMNMRDQQGT